MADSRSISGEVKIKDSSPEAVAFELMKFIRQSEPERQDSALELYARCLLTTKNPSFGLEKIKQMAQGK